MQREGETWTKGTRLNYERALGIILGRSDSNLTCLVCASIAVAPEKVITSITSCFCYPICEVIMTDFLRAGSALKFSSLAALLNDNSGSYCCELYVFPCTLSSFGGVYVRMVCLIAALALQCSR